MHMCMHTVHMQWLCVVACTAIHLSPQMLIEHIVTEYYPRLEAVDYVDTFRSLKTRCARSCAHVSALVAACAHVGVHVSLLTRHSHNVCQ